MVSPLDYIRKQQVASIEKMDSGICASAIGESIQGDSEIENGKFDILHASAEPMAYRSLMKSIAVRRSSSDKGPGCR